LKLRNLFEVEEAVHVEAFSIGLDWIGLEVDDFAVKAFGAIQYMTDTVIDMRL
jgi:hypothetical protein